MKNAFDTNRLGKMTIVAGIAGLITSISVLMGVGAGLWFLGSVGDLMDMLNSILLIPLLILLGNIVQEHSHNLGRVIQITGVVGAIIRFTGAFLIFSGILQFESGVLWVNGGVGLMGTAVLLFLLTSRASVDYKKGYFWFSIVVGFAMALNLLSVFLNDAFTPLLQGEVGFGDVSPFLIAILLFSPIFMLGYPIWLIWTGRLLLRKPDFLTVQPDPIYQ